MKRNIQYNFLMSQHLFQTKQLQFSSSTDLVTCILHYRTSFEKIKHMCK
uniref:Uncharacterized protein n=1 Tax=Arundo donax TaxID=35708 RepID=A0A0A8Z0J8_ARUDO